MSIFGSIMSKIFGHDAAATPAGAAPAGGAAPTGGAAPSGGTAPAGGAASTGGALSGAGAQSASVSGAVGGSPAGSVDVEGILKDLAAKSGRPSNWRVSIVDLMTLLGLDSSLSARKELAKELHYSGDTNDSASMNIWLHKQVMTKLAENGGKVPDDLKHA